MDNNFTLEDSLQLLANNYHKILRINLTEDSHTELKMYADEKNTKKGTLKEYLCGSSSLH